MEVTALLGNNNIEKENGGQYDTEMVALLLLLSTANVYNLSLLTLGMVKLFSKVTMLLGDNNIEKERGDQYDTAMFALFLLF